MPLPRKVKPGDPIKASDWNNLIDYVRSSQVQPSSGVRISRGPSGTTITSRRQPRGISSPQTFDFTLSPTTIDDAANVTLGWGNVTGNGIGLANGVNPYPEEFSATNTPPWTDTKPVTGDPSTLWYAYLIVTVNQDPAGDGSQPPVIESISWDVGSSMPSNDPTSWTYYMLLGMGYVSADGKTATVLNQTGIGSQTFGYCGGDGSAGGTGYWDPAGPAVTQ